MNWLKILLSISILYSINGYAEDIKYNKDTIKIAVLDTGYDFNSNWKYSLNMGKFGLKKPKLCKSGHKDFTNTDIQDDHGHGTHIVGLIAKEAKDANYCMIILKTWSPVSKIIGGLANYNAIVYAVDMGVDIINYSGGGKTFYLKEYLAVKKALDKGIVLVMAAGNERERVDYHVLKVSIKDKRTPYYIHRKTGHITTKTPKNTYFPAGYDPRIISVENIDKKGKLLSSSNYGETSYHQEVGDSVMSLIPNNKLAKMTGTSQATAVRTGKIVNKWDIK